MKQLVEEAHKIAQLREENENKLKVKLEFSVSKNFEFSSKEEEAKTKEKILQELSNLLSSKGYTVHFRSRTF